MRLCVEQSLKILLCARGRSSEAPFVSLPVSVDENYAAFDEQTRAEEMHRNTCIHMAKNINTVEQIEKLRKIKPNVTFTTVL